MRALLCGTFDPPTWGHLNLIERSSLLFGKLFVGVAQNSSKTKNLLPAPDRIALLKQLCKPHSNVEVVDIQGLTVDFAKTHEIDCLVRSMKGAADYDFEFQMASTNRKLTGIETIFLPLDPQFSYLSGTLIREVVASGDYSLKELVPPEVEYLLSTHLKKARA